MLNNFEYIKLLNIISLCISFFFIATEYFFKNREFERFIEYRKDIPAIAMMFILGFYFSKPLTIFFQTYSISTQTNEVSLSKIFFATLLIDFINYCNHFLMHKVKWYWKAHLSHHQIQYMNWLSGLRASVIHLCSFIFFRTLVAHFIFNLNLNELLIYFMIGYFFNCAQHTNTKTGLLKHIEWLFITPRVHEIHHLKSGKRTINLGAIFSVWDHLFGTYQSPDDYTKSSPLGIPSTKNESPLKVFLGI